MVVVVVLESIHRRQIVSNGRVSMMMKSKAIVLGAGEGVSEVVGVDLVSLFFKRRIRSSTVSVAMSMGPLAFFFSFRRLLAPLCLPIRDAKDMVWLSCLIWQVSNFFYRVKKSSASNTNATPTPTRDPRMSHQIRPLTAPTPEFFQTNPLEHSSLLLSAKSIYKRAESPDRLRQWTPLRTSSSLSSSVLRTTHSSHSRPPTRSELQAFNNSHTTALSSSSFSSVANSSLTLNDVEQANTSVSVSVSASSTPRSVHSKSAYFAAQAHRYVLSKTEKRKAVLILRQNKQLAEKFQLLIPLEDFIGKHSSVARPQTTGGMGRKRRRPSHDRAALLQDLTDVLKQVKTLRGITSEGDKVSAEDKIAKQLAVRAQRENTNVRQPGDTRGLSGRTRVDFKLDRFRDPNQLAVLMNSLGMKWGGGKKNASSATATATPEEDNENPTLKELAILRTPRTMEKQRTRWGNTIRDRQQQVKLRRAHLIQAEIQHVKDVGSTFKVARKQKEADDRLSNRKIARGWNKTMWRYIACHHFSLALERGKIQKRLRQRQQIAQIKIASSYRRSQSMKELRSRRKADYILKFRLNQIVKRWKFRRRKNDADVLRKWLMCTRKFSLRILGYAVLRKSACRIQMAWKNFVAIKTTLIEKLSAKMYGVAKADYNYRNMRRTTLKKIPALSAMPPWDIRYELLSNIVRPLRLEWMDKAMPKYKLDRQNYLRKKERYDRQRIQEENENRGKRAGLRKKELDLGVLLMSPVIPRFHVDVPDSVLLLCWKNATSFARKPFAWKKEKELIQDWLRDHRATKYHVNAPR